LTSRTSRKAGLLHGVRRRQGFLLGDLPLEVALAGKRDHLADPELQHGHVLLAEAEAVGRDVQEVHVEGRVGQGPGLRRDGGQRLGAGLDLGEAGVPDQRQPDRVLKGEFGLGR
jgi:hypothetical protein